MYEGDQPLIETLFLAMFLIPHVLFLSMIQAAMLYNKYVSEVAVYVTSVESLDKASTVMDNLVTEWTATGCPLHTRETIVPYTVSTPPHG